MKNFLVAIVTSLLLISCDFSNYIKEEKSFDFTTVFEKSEGQRTATYREIISYYENLASHYPSVRLMEMGQTDSGHPLHLALFSESENFDLERLRESHTTLMILNGIHPGESDGIDATMMLFRDLAQDSIHLPENTIIATIPVYNIGGALNRNSTTRTNQNGPQEYGFRGNARNYDLNRDFLKAETKNTQSFYEIFHYVSPDVFIDNHVSNGADYQYTLTHLFTQHNKLGGKLGQYLHLEMMPALEDALSKKSWDVTPYVNVFNDVPDKGFVQFMDYPRYSTGYAALWNTLSLMVETHMLKPYQERVWGTYELMRSMIDITDEDSQLIKKLRKEAFEDQQNNERYAFDFQVDSGQSTTLQFKGYEGEMVESTVTGMPRLKYDRNAPFTREVTYYNYFKPTREVSVPKAYIIPQGWWNVIDRLKLNGVEMIRYEKDSTITAQVYHIEDFDTRQAPYEGHYLHFNTKVSSSQQQVQVRKGDYLIPTNQAARMYLLAALEPEATDSFFNWNFFDSVLQQKEHFSAYVFEDIAQEMLDTQPELREAFEAKKADPEFARSSYAQLNWIYQQSPHYEASHLRYPIFRLN